jgi:hypothetical protein
MRDKDEMRELAKKHGLQYGGCDPATGQYFFQSGSYAQGFKSYVFIECDLTDENIKASIQNGWTRAEL